MLSRDLPFPSILELQTINNYGLPILLLYPIDEPRRKKSSDLYDTANKPPEKEIIKQRKNKERAV